jgi:Cu2+-exporting ATPase
MDHQHHAEHERRSRHSHRHEGHEALFRRKFFVCLALSLPVLVLDSMVWRAAGLAPPSFVSHVPSWVVPLFAVLIFSYGGAPFLTFALDELRARTPGMMTLVSMSITFALAYSLVSYGRGMHEGFFVELVTLIDVMLLGHWLEMRSIRAASGALVELARLIPDTAERIEPDGTYRAVATTELRVGDLVLVRPGASVPADGFVEEGESMVNEALITGESKPVRKRPGDSVIGGTINGEGSLRVRVSAVGDNTTLARIMRLVREAQESKSRTQLLADAAAGWLFYVALATAAISGVVWYLIEKSIEAVSPEWQLFWS